MANNLPTPQSYENLLADLLSSYSSKIGVNDLNVGSTVTSFFEVVALMVARSSGDTLQILRDFSVDRATGDALKRLATDNNITPITAQTATGSVTVIDTSFKKIASKVYAGVNPPNIGSVSVPVSDASLFPATGSIYIGRGTNNVEGPIPYSSITAVGGYYVLSLTAPTAKFHNVGEPVILAQGGNRSINVNSLVMAPSTGASADIKFSITTAAVILDGETTVTGVPVAAQEPGVDANVPSGGIKKFVSNPASLPQATVTNSLPYTTGKESETDDQLRVRIKRALASTGLGTATAVQSAVIGASPSDEAATIVSASIQTGTSSAILFIDDGTGYEAKTSGVGLESIVDAALGGEQFFQLATGGRQAPLAKAFLQSTNPAPFDLIGADTLAIVVGNTTYQHVFATSDFRSPGGATAFEVTASVNGNTALGFEATTAGGGQYVVFRSKTESNDSIQTTTPTTSGRDAAVQMGLPSNQIQTLRLYKNNVPLNKDGNLAAIFTQAQTLWSNAVANGETLILSVDGTQSTTFTINDADFIKTGLYTSVSATNTLASWATVLNTKLTGVTVGVVGQTLEITSNLGANNRASIVVDPSSSLVAKGLFSSTVGLSSQGSASDFTLNRNTAQIELVAPLVANDLLAAGSTKTQATIKTLQNSGGSVTLTSNGHIWLLVDAAGAIVPTGLTGNSTITITKPSANVVRYASSVASAFSTVQVGDYVIIWSAELNPTARLEARIFAKTNSSIDLQITSAEWSAIATTVGAIYAQGIVVLRSASVPQKFKVSAGTSTLDVVSAQLQAQTNEINFSVLSEQYIVAGTKTKDSSGFLLVVTSDGQGSLAGFQSGVSDSSKTSLIANYDSFGYDSALPLFFHSPFSSENSADPIDGYISNLSSGISLAGQDPNEIVSFLQPYGAISDSQPFGEYVQETSVSGTSLGVNQQPRLRRVRIGDRFFVANPLDFGNADTAVVVLDSDTSNKSFEIPLFRRAITNTTISNGASSFNAYDVDSGASANFSSSFGTSFDFSNFKALIRAKKTLKPTPTKTAILYRSVLWGRSGEKVSIGYSYPAGPNTAIGSTVVVNSSVSIFINLASGTPINSSIDGSTEWNVSVTPHTPATGTDQVTFSYSGLGSAPALNLNGGEYVNILSTTELNLANTGTFRVSTQTGFAPTSTSFTVAMTTGTAISQVNAATQVANGIAFYQASPTTAAQVQTYVAANLAAYVSASLVIDGDATGSGVIALSTYEDSGFAYNSQFLQDGINWIATSNLGGSPQFTFKRPLALPSDVGYSFNSAEEIRLIPTTMDQVARLSSVLAVTGFTTVGTINLVDRGTKLELATDVIGSGGAIQIIGGNANGFSVPVLDSAIRIDNNNSLVSVDAVSGSGILSDQWFRLQATNKQNKLTFINSNTSVTIQSQTPSTGLSTVSLLNKTLTQRYFGRPRHNVRVNGNTFRVEKQGSLVCISWNGAGTSPQFLKASLSFNDSAGGTTNIYKVIGSNDAIYQILSGPANFVELSINDKISISGMTNSGNNGTFLVTGVSDDGKMVQVLNSNAVNQYSAGQLNLGGQLTTSDSFLVGSNTLVAGTDFAIGFTVSQTAANLSAIIGTLTGFGSSSSSNVVTVKATSSAQISVLSHSGPTSVAVSPIQGQAFAASNFSAQSGVIEGDNVVIAAPFAVLNRGKFRVVRRFNDSIWIENQNAIVEEVTLVPNLISLGFDTTTSFKVNATDSKIYLNWNGTGTEPLLGNAQVGDTMTFGTDFSSSNQGTFMVTRSGFKLQQISQFAMPTGIQFSTTGVGTYFTMSDAGNINNYFAWFNVNSGNTAPTPAGTAIQVAILSSDSATQIASKFAAAINGIATGLIAIATNGVVTTTTVDFIETNAPTNIGVPAPGTVTMIQSGRRTFVECLDSAAVNQSSVAVTNVLNCNRPQMAFSSYDSTVAGDQLVISGTTLGSSNAGAYTVVQVLSRDSVVVSGILAAVTNVSLNNSITSLAVLEDAAYFGYKHVLFASSQPSAPTRTAIVFDSNHHYTKINQAAGVQITSLSKLAFPTTVRKGLDSYAYNTGLIAEANRILYGDPRDRVTYQGVAAAGANIFVREPLTLRVKVAIEVRLATGAPFATVAQAVRSAVAAVINSNPVGQSIDISSLISAARSVGGVLSVTIDSPLYNSSHDLIALTPGQKARIIDPSTDISISSLS